MTVIKKVLAQLNQIQTVPGKLPLLLKLQRGKHCHVVQDTAKKMKQIEIDILQLEGKKFYQQATKRIINQYIHI